MKQAPTRGSTPKLYARLKFPQAHRATSAGPVRPARNTAEIVPSAICVIYRHWIVLMVKVDGLAEQREEEGSWEV